MPENCRPCRRALLAMAGTVLASLALIGAFVQVGGAPDDNCVARNNCYCEAIGDGLVRQPINSWSSLCFLALGAWTLWEFLRAARKNPYREDLKYLFLFPAISTWLGPAALVYHMTVRFNAGVFDQTSIVLLICYSALFNFQRVFGWPTSLGRFLAAYAAMVLTVAASTLSTNLLGIDLGSWGLSDGIVSVFGVGTIVLTIVSWSGSRSPARYRERPSPARVLFPLLMTAALFVWTTSQSGGLLCAPEGGIGHAAWHVTAALALAAAFRGWLAHPRGLHA